MTENIFLQFEKRFRVELTVAPAAEDDRFLDTFRLGVEREYPNNLSAF